MMASLPALLNSEAGRYHYASQEDGGTARRMSVLGLGGNVQLVGLGAQPRGSRLPQVLIGGANRAEQDLTYQLNQTEQQRANDRELHAREEQDRTYERELYAKAVEQLSTTSASTSLILSSGTRQQPGTTCSAIAHPSSACRESSIRQ